MWPATVTILPQEEDLQEIVAKISSKRAEYDVARAHMAEYKVSYEKAEEEYKQHKEQINTAAEEADSKKVESLDLFQFGWNIDVLTDHMCQWVQSTKWYILASLSCSNSNLDISVQTFPKLLL